MRFRDGYNFMKEEGVFFNRLYQMVQTKERDPRVCKAEKNKLKTAYYLLTVETLQKIVGSSRLKKMCSYINQYIIRQPSLKFDLTRSLRETTAPLLKAFQAENAYETILNIVEDTNVKYNSYVTNEEKWLAIKVEFLRYNFISSRELEELKNLVEAVRNPELAKEFKTAYEKLVNEQQELSEMVRNLKPENYEVEGEAKFREDCNQTLRLIWEGMELYEDDEESLGEDAHEYESNEEQSDLASLLQSARILRSEREEEKTREIVRSDAQEAR